MVQKWNGPKKPKRDKHPNDAVAKSVPVSRSGFFSIHTKLAVMGVTVFVASLGVGIYINAHDAPESQSNLNKPVGKLASVLKKPSVMQPLPEMPSESMPGISAQQELLVPGDAINVQSIDPIITGPRAYKPRADARSAASKDS